MARDLILRRDRPRDTRDQHDRRRRGASHRRHTRVRPRRRAQIAPPGMAVVRPARWTPPRGAAALARRWHCRAGRPAGDARAAACRHRARALRVRSRALAPCFLADWVFGWRRSRRGRAAPLPGPGVWFPALSPRTALQEPCTLGAPSVGARGTYYVLAVPPIDVRSMLAGARGAGIGRSAVQPQAATWHADVDFRHGEFLLSLIHI